jgi:amino acid transporter
MARDGRLPAPLARVHLTRRTPHVAIAVILAILATLALAGDISELASATVLLLLTVFVIVNSSLVVLRLRPGEPKGGFEVPIAIPALGAIVCLTLLVVRVASGDARAPIIAAVLLAVVASLYLLVRPRTVAA